MKTALQLPPEMTIYTIGELRSAWLAALDAAARPRSGRRVAAAVFAVDAAATEELDGAGVQLLLSLARSLDALGRPLRLVAPSPALCTALAALGLHDLLGEEGAAGAAA